MAIGLPMDDTCAEMSSNTSYSRRLTLGLVIWAFLLLFRLDVDAPTVVTPHYTGNAHRLDEFAKAHESRNEAVFGQSHLNKADGYAFWRVQSPVWFHLQSTWFRAFSRVDLFTARLLSVIFSLLGMAFFIGAVWLAIGRREAWLTFLLLAGNFSFLLYSRLALMETGVFLFIFASIFCIALAERAKKSKRLAALVAGVAFAALATLTKQTGFVFFPFLLSASLAVAIRSRDRFMVILLTGAMATFTLLLGWYCSQDEYLAKLGFNQVHLMGKKSVAMADRFVLVLTIIKNLACFLAPITSFLGIATIWRMRKVGIMQTLRYRYTVIPLLIFILLGVTLTVNLISRHEGVIRFQIIILPFLCAAAAVGVSWVCEAQNGKLYSRIGSLLLVLFLSYHGGRYIHWHWNATRTLAEAPVQLEELLTEKSSTPPEDVVLIGQFSPQLAFGTKYKQYYVRKRFNDTREIVEALGVTHIAIATVRDREFLRRLLPKRFKARRKLGEVPLWRSHANIYELPPP